MLLFVVVGFGVVAVLNSSGGTAGNTGEVGEEAAAASVPVTAAVGNPSTSNSGA